MNTYIIRDTDQQCELARLVAHDETDALQSFTARLRVQVVCSYCQEPANGMKLPHRDHRNRQLCDACWPTYVEMLNDFDDTVRARVKLSR